MGKRKVTINRSVAESIAEIAWFIESKGLIKTAEKYSDSIYDFFETLADGRKSYTFCRDNKRALLGYKCVQYRRKDTVVFLETDDEIIVCEFIPSKLIHW
jgi:plasmid stabilization system protein ParE